VVEKLPASLRDFGEIVGIAYLALKRQALFLCPFGAGAERNTDRCSI
jgi:hypothetical protein